MTLSNNTKDDEKKRKSILPWKTKFGGRKKKHESLEQGLDEDHPALSQLGNKRKHAWRSSKHLSTPAEVTTLWRFERWSNFSGVD